MLRAITQENSFLDMRIYETRFGDTVTVSPGSGVRISGFEFYVHHDFYIHSFQILPFKSSPVRKPYRATTAEQGFYCTCDPHRVSHFERIRPLTGKCLAFSTLYLRDGQKPQRNKNTNKSERIKTPKTFCRIELTQKGEWMLWFSNKIIP